MVFCESSDMTNIIISKNITVFRDKRIESKGQQNNGMCNNIAGGLTVAVIGVVLTSEISHLQTDQHLFMGLLSEF